MYVQKNSDARLERFYNGSKDRYLSIVLFRQGGVSAGASS
jgi:hypothetical protein